MSGGQQDGSEKYRRIRTRTRNQSRRTRAQNSSRRVGLAVPGRWQPLGWPLGASTNPPSRDGGFAFPTHNAVSSAFLASRPEFLLHIASTPGFRNRRKSFQPIFMWHSSAIPFSLNSVTLNVDPDALLPSLQSRSAPDAHPMCYRATYAALSPWRILYHAEQ